MIYARLDELSLSNNCNLSEHDGSNTITLSVRAQAATAGMAQPSGVRQWPNLRYGSVCRTAAGPGGWSSPLRQVRQKRPAPALYQSLKSQQLSLYWYFQ